jgi:hypothetical protein
MSIRFVIPFNAVDYQSSRTSKTMRLMKCKSLGGGVDVVGVCRRLSCVCRRLCRRQLPGRLPQALPPASRQFFDNWTIKFCSNFQMYGFCTNEIPDVCGRRVCPQMSGKLPTCGKFVKFTSLKLAVFPRTSKVDTKYTVLQHGRL